MKKELVFNLSVLVMLFSFLLIPSHRAYADDVKITIEGKVVDIKEHPLQGVAVIVKGTGQGENPVFRITKKYVPLNR